MRRKTEELKGVKLPEGVSTVPVGDNVGEARLQCPRCGGPIALRLTALLVGQPTWCSGCGGKLNFNPAQNRQSLDAWQRFSNKVEKIRRDGGASKGRRKSTRRRVR